ncbi:hypothetical protein Ab1vBOLIVR5_gp105c [Agrobacterium phage OLIVR5]|uniref:Uncharacterized protein n=1 Tax=Agrobacterium phage OLIVR5 TaxID=2723773 RepID=A0A858MTA1_9CAUD|nr:hypothetical protein KNU99_gp105 [Agrobacterium phage OLIVR5]QIW87753.1 hypothetical protein Ab1vBOLIVR5_gp105c [Agrobacterium phage OLIVR5]QIW88015.1 hypothetical protein Ab1vBOLIVR6_gp108c [Agrobacterium phage OLIVR6]
MAIVMAINLVYLGYAFARLHRFGDYKMSFMMTLLTIFTLFMSSIDGAKFWNL